jgi:hypothetical protein
MQPQGELQLNLAPEPTPAVWEQFQVPAVDEKLPAGAAIPFRRMGKIIEIDFDGRMLKATRQSRGRIFVRLPNGETIQEVGLDKFMLRVAIAREYRREVARSKEAEEHERELRKLAEKAAQEAAEQRQRERAIGERLAQSIEERSVAKPRSRNKLAKTAEPCGEKIYINPFQDRPSRFNQVPRWLERQQDPSPLEKLMYGALTFPTKIQKNERGKKVCGFCSGWDESKGEVFGIELTMLARHLGAGRSATSEAFDSLGFRNLIDIGNRKKRGLSKTVRFLEHRWRGESCLVTGQLHSGRVIRSPTNSSPVNGQQVEPLPANSSPVTGELSLALKNKEHETAAAAALDYEWLNKIAEARGWNEKRKKKEWQSFLRWTNKCGKNPSRELFENSHLPNVREPAKPIFRTPAPEIAPAPDFNDRWNEWWKMMKGDASSCPPFADAPDKERAQFLEALTPWEDSRERNK